MELIRKRSGAAIGLLLLILLILLAQNGAAAADILRERVTLCLQTLIPALYGCTAAALLLRETGAAERLGAGCKRTAHLLGIPADRLAVFAVSQLAGYPVGSLLLRDLPARARRTERLCALCYGCGPAFAVGFAGGTLFGDAFAGWMLLCACILSNLLLALLTRRSIPHTPPPPPVQLHFSAEMLPDTASGTMKTMSQICGMVLLFGVVRALCDLLGVTAAAVRFGGLFGVNAQTARAVFSCILDVTQLPALFRCGLSYRLLLSLTGALLSFGGLCVMLQCQAVGRGNCRLRTLIFMRIFAAVLTFLLLYAAAPLHVPTETAAVFAPRTAVSGSGSVLPALLIICTGFPFLIKKD